MKLKISVASKRVEPLYVRDMEKGWVWRSAYGGTDNPEPGSQICTRNSHGQVVILAHAGSFSGIIANNQKGIAGYEDSPVAEVLGIIDEIIIKPLPENE